MKLSAKYGIFTKARKHQARYGLTHGVVLEILGKHGSRH